MEFKYIDIFAGCGGLSLGLFNSGWSGVLAIEKGQDAFATLNYNLIEKIAHLKWPNEIPKKNHDINEFIIEYRDYLLKLRNTIDLVAGGPPCQGFSMAGRRKENDLRNSLIYSYIEFIKLINPKLIFFENVKGFTLEFSKNKGQGIKYSNLVLKALEECGYDVTGKIVDFSDYGVPQRRKRFILIGVRKDLQLADKLKYFFDNLSANCKSFLDRKKLLMKPTISEAISDLLKANKSFKQIENSNFEFGLYSDSKSSYQTHMRSGSINTFPDSHRFANHSEGIKAKFKTILENPLKNKSISDEVREQFKIKKHRVIPLAENDQCPTLTTLPDDIIHYSEPRILTVREYARIQTFPDWFEFKGKYTTGGNRRILEVPRYTQIGNAIPPLFSEQCGLLLKSFL